MNRSVLHNRFKSSFLANNIDEDNDNLIKQDEEIEFKYKEKRFDRIPWKGIILALMLTLIGLVIIIIFACSQMKLIDFKPDDDFTFLTLAFITLVPGLYHSLIAFRAYLGYEGYSFDDIADLN